MRLLIELRKFQFFFLLINFVCWDIFPRIKLAFLLTFDIHNVLVNHKGPLISESGIKTKEELLESNNQDIISISSTGILSSSVLNELPVFPTSYLVKGIVSRSFEPELNHFGLDIAAREGANVQAIEDGTVVNISWTITNGYVLSIQHKGGYLSVYKHCRTITKEIGDVVVKGDVIASVGNAGTQSSASHLHVEIWEEGHPQDPELYFLK